jgi:ethanolamine utilization protein EutQ
MAKRPATERPAKPARKAPAKVIPYENVPFAPRFAYGEMCDIGPVVGERDGAPFGFGFARMTGAEIPWTITYDEVLLVISGVIRIRIGRKVLAAGPGDSVWLPAGTALVYEAQDCLVAYAVHPLDATPAAS